MGLLPVTPIRKETLVCHYRTELVGTLSRQNVSARFFTCRSHPGYFADSLRWRNAWKNRGGGVIARDLQRLSPIWALVLVYGIFSLTSHLNIGHRHLLPIYPAIFITCGACTYFFRGQSGRAVAIFAIA